MGSKAVVTEVLKYTIIDDSGRRVATSSLNEGGTRYGGFIASFGFQMSRTTPIYRPPGIVGCKLEPVSHNNEDMSLFW
jgi:hypothetical protein